MILRKIFLVWFICTLILFANSKHEQKIAQLLKEAFQTHYPSMEIHSLHLTPSSSLIRKLDAYQVDSITITPNTMRRAKGSVMVLFKKGTKKRKLYFKYTLDATVTLYKSSQPIQKGRTLTPELATQATIPFTRLYHPPLKEDAFYHYCAKVNIKEDTILSLNQLKKEQDIHRNDAVTAIIKDGALQLSFRAKALQAGDIGEIIKIKKDYKKSFKAKIIDKSTVEVIE